MGWSGGLGKSGRVWNWSGNSVTVVLVAWCLVAAMVSIVYSQTYVQPIVMAWQPPNPDSSDVPDSYCIYRNVNGGGFSQVTCVAVPTLTYTDSAITFGNRYCYKSKSKKGTTESTDYSQGFCVSALPTVGR